MSKYEAINAWFALADGDWTRGFLSAKDIPPDLERNYDQPNRYKVAAFLREIADGLEKDE